MNESIGQIRQAIEGQRLTVNRLDDGTAVLLDIEGEQLMTLNPTALCLVDWIEAGVDSPDGLARKLCARFEVGAEQAGNDAADFVDTLARAVTGP